MGTLTIDGVGSVEIGPEFSGLTPEQQAATVSEIVAKIKGGQAPATSPPPEVRAPRPAGEVLEEPPPAPPPPEPGVAAAAGRVAQRAGEAAVERFNDRPLGLSEQTIKELQAAGALAAEGQAPTPIQLLNQVVYQFGAKAGDAILRSIGAGIGALSGAAEQMGVEAGMSQGEARRLGRDVGLGAEVAAIVSGAPAAMAQRAVARSVGATQRAAAGEVAAARAASPAAAAKTTEEFKTAARSFYQQADDAGVVVKPESFKALSDDIFLTTARAGIDKTLTPNSTAAVARIQELAQPGTGPISFQTLDLMRQIASDAKAGAKASDRRVATIITDKIDDYIARLGSKDVVAGDAKVAADAIVQARDLWSRAAKLETVETLIQRAADSAKTFSGSGFENALRTEFKNLAKNARAMRTFTEAEQKAIRQVARGTVSANTARNIGKLAPTGVVSGALGGGIGAAVGTAIGVGPVAGAVAAGSIGFAGRRLATILTQRSIRNLEDVIRRGESPLATSALGRGTALLGQLGGATAPVAAGQSGQPTRDTSETADSRYKKVVAALESARAAIDPFGGRAPTLGGSLSLAMSAIPGGGAIGAKLYPALLKQAGTNRAAFDVIINSLKADKSLSAAELGRIANEFANTVTKYKNKEQMFQEIVQAFTRRARFENKIAPSP